MSDSPPPSPPPGGRGTTVRGPSSDGPGDSIGPYRLLERLGEGGFGVVWLAERRAPFVQRVALKVIKPGMDSRGVIARFDQERHALCASRQRLATSLQKQGKWDHAFQAASRAFQDLVDAGATDPSVTFEPVSNAWVFAANLCAEWKKTDPGRDHELRNAELREWRSRFSPFREAYRSTASTSALNNRVWYVVRFADSAAQVGEDELAEVVKDAAAAVAREPDAFRTCVNTYGIALFRLGEYAKAIEVLTRAEEGDLASGGQREFANWIFIAIAHQRLGQSEQAVKARAVVEDLLQLRPPGEDDEETRAWLHEYDKEFNVER